MAGSAATGVTPAPRVPTAADLQAAQVRLAGKVRRTPMLALHGSELGVSARVVLKLELLQHTGSFKARGALNALLSREVPAAGVVAASGGNHGAAVAWAAQTLGVSATVFVPSTSPPLKAGRIRRYGARVEIVDGFYADAVVAAAEFARTREVASIHAYDDTAVVAGQGTVGLEIRDQVPEADSVLVTVGGGGLVAGITLAHGHRPATVVPVEPRACPTLHRALAAGTPVDVDVAGIAADSTGARTAGTIATAVLRAAGAAVRQVDDEAILAAQRWLWDRCRVAAEPGGAVALAGLMTGVYEARHGETVVVVVCGGNAEVRA